MSPRLSLTTNVLPSRIFTRSSATTTQLSLLSRSGPGCRSTGWARQDPLKGEKEVDVSLDDQRAPQHRGHRVLSTRSEPVEQRLRRTQHAIGSTRLVRNRNITLAHVESPTLDTFALA